MTEWKRRLEEIVAWYVIKILMIGVQFIGFSLIEPKNQNRTKTSDQKIEKTENQKYVS